MKKFVLALIVVILFIAWIYYPEIKFFFYKQNHPGVVGYDHGILSIKDIEELNKSNYFNPPLLDGTMTGGRYWQCFNKKYFTMECSYQEPLDKEGSSLGIDIATETEIHSYGLNHAIAGVICDELMSNIKRVLQNQTYFCIYGFSGELDRVTSKREYSWTLIRLKTKNGYAHYFLDDEFF